MIKSPGFSPTSEQECARAPLRGHTPPPLWPPHRCVWNSAVQFVFGVLHEQQLAQAHPELLRAAGQLLHPLRHLFGCSSTWILQRSCFRTDYDVFEFFTQGVAALGHATPHLWRLGLA